MNSPAVEDRSASLQKGFHFSQSNLQDYLECRRRFQLRYILGFIWPAVESEPALEHEQYIQRGISLHRLIHRFLLGVSRNILDPLIESVDLQQWWQDFHRFVEYQGILGDADLHPEYSLTAGLGEFRLVGKYDLITRKSSGEFVIYDWKTSRWTPDRSRIAGRMQTQLYPYLLVRAGTALNEGHPIDPEIVTMAYWYSSSPDQAIAIQYSGKKYNEDHRHITDLVAEISNLPPDRFYITKDVLRCAYCVFRSFCERGDQAGDISEWGDQADEPDHSDMMFDFDSISEIDL